MQNRIFFPQDALDQWMVDERIDVSGTELTVRDVGRRYRMAEAFLVAREVTGAGDPHELVGRVKTKTFLEELGAEVFERSMVLGDFAYDVVPGWLGVPMGPLSEATAEAARKGEDVKTDEELLSRYLLQASG